MKKLILLAILVNATGCTTVKQAQIDFRNFKRTIQYNTTKPAVLKNATFTETRWPSYDPRYL